VQNNRVLINGGSGFDTVVLAGTALEDEFYIFTDTTGKQYIFGAGLKIEGVSNVERLAILSGGDDDKIYLYGLNENLELLINTGSGNDEVILGGDQVDFEVVYPESSAVYTVEKTVIKDETVGDAELDFNEILFKKRTLSIPEMEEQFKVFFAKWVNPAATKEHIDSVKMDLIHWKLLEANLAVALKLYSQGVERAIKDPVYGTTIWDSIDFGNLTNGIYEELNEAFYGTAQYGADVDAFEAAILKSVTDGLNGDGDFEFGFTLTSNAPELPDDISYQTLLNLSPDRAVLTAEQQLALQALKDSETSNYFNYSADFDGTVINEDRDLQAGATRSLDKAFFDDYLRTAVAYSIWGGNIQADQIYDSTINGVNRVDDWGYDPDLFLGDLYADAIYYEKVGLEWYWSWGSFSPKLREYIYYEKLAAVVGGEASENHWMPSDIWSEGQGGNLFRDLIAMFYEPEAIMPNDSFVNVSQDYQGMESVGDASYRFDDLTERTVMKILPASYDLTNIAGTVRLAGGPGTDTLVLNIKDDTGAELNVGRIDLDLADYNYGELVTAATYASDGITELTPNVFNLDDSLITYDDGNGNTGTGLTGLLADVAHADLQGALERANKQTQFGMLDGLLATTTGTTNSLGDLIVPLSEATVSLQIEAQEDVFVLTDSLTALRNAVTNRSCFILRILRKKAKNCLVLKMEKMTSSVRVHFQSIA